MKVCAICKVRKKNAEFNKHASAKDGLQWCCRECRRYYEFGRKYGIDREQWESMMLWTGGSCWCCSSPIELTGIKKHDPKTAARVDHSHRSGRVRGLLCSHCNTGYGLVGDNLEGVAKLLLYAFQGVGDPNLAEQILGQFGITLDLSDITEGVHIPWLHGSHTNETTD